MMNEASILRDFNRYKEFCTQENKINFKNLEGQTLEALRANQRQVNKGGRPKKGARPWTTTTS